MRRCNVSNRKITDDRIDIRCQSAAPLLAMLVVAPVSFIRGDVLLGHGLEGYPCYSGSLSRSRIAVGFLMPLL